MAEWDLLFASTWFKPARQVAIRKSAEEHEMLRRLIDWGGMLAGLAVIAYLAFGAYCVGGLCFGLSGLGLFNTWEPRNDRIFAAVVAALAVLAMCAFVRFWRRLRSDFRR